jgi:2-polyprenyl-6-methoxyphenol hydroxylase-like FAD-dependent oxidoreductase
MPDPVLIVGAGPTGLTAALELSRLGVPVRLIEKEASAPAAVVSDPSRAIGVQARTLELLEARGLSEEMSRRGHHAVGACVYGGGKRLFRLDFSRIDSRYNYLLFVSQTETERLLGRAVEKRGVAIERGVELVGFAQDALAHDPNPVKVVLRHADGRLEQAQAPWLVDAEGAHSVVRTTLGLRFEGRTLDRHFALGDVTVDADLVEADSHVFSTEDGFLGLFPLGHTRFRVVAANPLSEPREGTAPTIEELQAIYDRRSHIPARLGDLRWSSWFHISSRMVRHLRVDRVLLGGDSAHIHSPAAGQGMNTGIQDMFNLAWKLAMVINGEAPEALLDTYEQERLPVMRDVLSTTEMLTDLVGSSHPVVRRLISQLGPWVGAAGKVQELVPFRISQLALGYRGSPLSAHHGRAGRLHAGDRLPDLLVRCRTAHGEGWREKPVFAIVDPYFTLLVVQPDADGAAGVDWCEAVRPWEPVIRVVGIAPPSGEAARARFHAAFGRSRAVFLVRPDGYVGFAGGKHASARHLASYCRRWLTVREPVPPVRSAAQ